jgi:preprotein translocase subunit SecE
MYDRYTKIVLTVIAVCLLKIAFADLISPAEAQGGVQR